LHFDNHDVIAVQIEGIKKWKVYNPTYSYPLEDERSFDYLPPNFGKVVICHSNSRIVQYIFFKQFIKIIPVD
ncbi:JmjC domain-containing protein, partial [Escherichia coli]